MFEHTLDMYVEIYALSYIHIKKMLSSLSYLNIHYIGSDSLPKYSFISCSILIFAMISSFCSSVNHWAIDFAIPFLSQKAIIYPFVSFITAKRFSSPTGSHLLSLLSFKARAGIAQPDYVVKSS